jgi:phosphatidylethanolamine-binding protein (PEBP) family uncharacterized protein
MGGKYIVWAAMLGIAIFMADCALPKRADTFQPLRVSFEWQGNAGSLSSPNPRIAVADVPQGTAFLRVRMKDLDRPNIDHGGGIVAYDGTGVIPAGALRGYRGPQPPAPEVHTYVFTVTALNADKSLILGEGEASRKYPER